jgi:hypothetical protein
MSALGVVGCRGTLAVDLTFLGLAFPAFWHREFGWGEMGFGRCAWKMGKYAWICDVELMGED